jgi:hypothetical protein
MVLAYTSSCTVAIHLIILRTYYILYNSQTRLIKMSIYTSSGAKSNILSLLMMITIWVPYIFGIGFSFYRFGNNDGILSIVIPPYAWYRGISYIWVEPKGKEKWEYHTGLMASLIATAPMENPLTDMERQRKLLYVQKWISGLPEQKRNALLNKATALGSAIEAYFQETFINIRNNGVQDQDQMVSSQRENPDVLFQEYSTLP